MIFPLTAVSSSRPWMLPQVVLVIASLYFGRDVLMPLALAGLLSFLLAPIITRLQRWRVGRIPAVLTVVMLAFALFGALGWVVAGQLFSLANKLPEYRQNLQTKIKSVWKPLGKELDKSSATVRELNQQMSSEPNQVASSKTMKVEIVESRWGALSVIRDALGPTLKPLGMAGIVIILVIFMLLKREDLRDRLIYLIGPGRLHATTEALDDAASRVSRYLLMQLIVNGAQGIAVGIGLFAIGVPNAALWGLVSALLRFIPYIGPCIAALAPPERICSCAWRLFQGLRIHGSLLGS
jgi:predicted PurR-regulated permease PerM